jgi:hypothetical protein
MSKHPIMVAVDGSAESDAAVRRAAREALLRDADIRMLHVVAPVVVTWPVGYLRASYAEWQEANAQNAIEQAQKIFHAEVGNTKLPAVKAQVQHDYVAGATLASSRYWAWIGTSTRIRATSSSPNDWPVGRSNIPMSTFSGGLYATGRHAGSSTSLSTLSW